MERPLFRSDRGRDHHTAVPFAALLVAFASARITLRARSLALRRAFLRRVVAWFSILWSSRVRRLPIVNPFRLGVVGSLTVIISDRTSYTAANNSAITICTNRLIFRREKIYGKMLTNPDQYCSLSLDVGCWMHGLECALQLRWG